MFKKLLKRERKPKKEHDFFFLDEKEKESIRTINFSKSKSKFTLINKEKEIKLKEAKRNFIIFSVFLFILASITIITMTVLKSAVITYTLNIYKEKVPSNNSNQVIFTAENRKIQEETKSAIEYKAINEFLIHALELEKDEEKLKQIRATGKIKIYNQQDIQQRLIDTTQFIDEETKLIYRIVGNHTIPAKKDIIVDAYADLPGEEYNTSNSQKVLKVKNFSKNKNKYEKVYGTIEQDFTGGLNKEVLSLSQNKINQELEKIDAELQQELEKNLNAKIQKLEEEEKTDYIYFKNLFKNIEKETTEDDFILDSRGQKISRQLDITIPIFRRAEINKLIIQSIINPQGQAKFANHQNWLVANLEDLQFDYTSQNALEKAEFKFTIKGIAEIHYQLDEKDLLKKIVGQDKKVFEDEKAQIMQEVPNPFLIPIDLNIKPFWLTKTPDNEKRISFEKRLE